MKKNMFSFSFFFGHNRLLNPGYSVHDDEFARPSFRGMCVRVGGCLLLEVCVVGGSISSTSCQIGWAHLGQILRRFIRYKSDGEPNGLILGIGSQTADSWATLSVNDLLGHPRKPTTQNPAQSALEMKQPMKLRIIYPQMPLNYPTTHRSPRSEYRPSLMIAATS